MKTKVGSPGHDPEQARRFAIAVPAAIVITAIMVVLGREQPPEPTIGDHFRPTSIVLERRPPTPRPTPKPTAPPTLPPIARVTLAPVPLRAAPVVAPHVRPPGGAHAAPHAIARIAQAKTFAAPQAAGGTGTDVAAGTGAGSGSGDARGSGDASSGDAVNADAPCGVVDLIPVQSPDRSGSTIFEHIRATVHFPDGHTQDGEFPYRFRYDGDDADPWSLRNLRNKDMVALVQPAPAGANMRSFPEVIRYVLDHTRDDGRTVLQECPRLR